MYNEFFGLRKSPFHLTPDPEFLYVTEQYREALAGLTYAIMARKGFVVLTGNAGIGKTTLLTRILQHLPVKRIQSSVIVNPTLTPAEFLEAAMLDFGFRDIPASKAQRIVELQNFLWKGHREGKITALVVDEAHKLSPEVLEEIRLLGNFESADEKLLQIVLVGQSELDEVLNSERLRQLKQRIALHLALDPLSGAEIARYVGHRWARAGGNQAPFSADAIDGIGQASKGIPRVINVICDNALMLAFGEGRTRVEGQHVSAVCRELRLPAPVLPVAEKKEEAPPAPPEPVAAEAAPEEFSLKTLERYNIARPSLWTRIVGKLGIVQRTATT